MRCLISMMLLVLTAGCSVTGNGPIEAHPAAPFFGTYRGGFDSASTETPEDDLNHNPCRETAQQACLTHHAPLDDILLDLRRNRAGDVTLAFYRNRRDHVAGRELDLLGQGCGTRIGPLEHLEGRRVNDGHLVARFPVEASNRLCLGKLRPVSHHYLNLELHATPDGQPQARVVIDRNVRDENYLYVRDDGVRRRVKIDLDNTVHEDHLRRYRVCIEDDYGEYGDCVLTDRQFRSFTLPLPVPGGVAVNYTWWQELRPRLQRTEGRYVVERYVGSFAPVGQIRGDLP